MNTGDVAFPPRAIAVDTAPIVRPVEMVVDNADDVSARKLRNRLMLLNAAVWIAVIVALQIIFF